MSAFLKNAKHTYDVESELHYVAVEYTQWNDDAYEYETYTDYLETKPLGDWTEITSLRKHLQYEKFLDTMVEQTIEVIQRKASLSVQVVHEKHGDNINVKIWLLNCMKIIDPTFEPPLINKRARWQKELVDCILSDTMHDLIERCRNTTRLNKLYHVTKIIELESQ